MIKIRKSLYVPECVHVTLAVQSSFTYLYLKHLFYAVFYDAVEILLLNYAWGSSAQEPSNINRVV